MKGLDININDLDLNKDYAVYLGRLLAEVRKQGDIELVYALERNLINNGKLLPNKNDLKLF